MTFHPNENAEPIPGYLLKERIGVGGYGEVWKVSAPGGLTKAIKFVYGRMDDERAARELKALGRIKEVRHPFLLSLERFDVLDGQLMVVTELADMSLMDRFRQCKDEGLPGIPRGELLEHLRDAADALDYMSEKYGLQHLDIKPENLLLVGGRIKVADFGLVKDLQDAHATAIGGVTPLYATPEAFDGKASRQSDQYSLAIVYQEMLTGSLPFPGLTAVQLAVQHMHSPPLLNSLPAADRPTVARALSKAPVQRFHSCREMVDHLAGAAQRVDSPRETPQPVRPQYDEAETAADGGQPRSTVDLRSTPCGSFLDETRNHRQTSAAVEPEEHDLPLPPLAAPNVEAGIRPTVIIGIGGMAARVLRRLRRRLQQRFGDREAAPAFQLLLLDTDPQTLRAAEQGDPDDALLPRETVYLPLRKPAEYRAASDKILGWLSRRWLYNIPRSLRTEGLRPLGRLAYVDHAELVKARIREALAESVSPESLSKTVQTAGVGLRTDAPRVFVISSISGGTGGGMLFDAAYAVRQLLAEMGFDPRDVCGVMSHATLNKNAANDLRKANAYAALTELHYFNHCGGGFKSGAASVLPAGELSEPPFTDSYLINLGDNLSEAELETGCSAIARYLYLDVATACGRLLDQCRQATREQIAADDGVQRLRSFAIHAIGCDKHSLAAAQADGLCHRLVSGWHSEEHARRRPEKPELEIEELVRRLYAAADKALGGSAAEQFRIAIEQGNMISRVCTPGAEQGGPFAEHLERIHALVRAPAEANQPAPAESTRVESALQDAAKKLAAALSGSIVKSITAMVENPRDRLPAALLAVRMFQEQLRSFRQDADEEFRRLNAESAQLRLKLHAGEV
ncbi:MAG TPA: tubulin-like doman-containing protein, partial [Pirellulales bacterium]|nr:tubulin-like doman-containing protein [Pirellulales bacterium]